MAWQVTSIKEVINRTIVGKILPAHDEKGHHYRFFDTDLVVDSVTTIIGRVLSKPHLLPRAIRRGVLWLEINDRWQNLKDPTLREEYITGAISAHTDIRDDAGGVGTIAHDAIEKYINIWLETGEAPLDIRKMFANEDEPRAIAAARGAEELMKKHNVVPIASELLVGDKKVSAGTLDFLCLWDGELTLVDWKSSNSIGDDYAMQTAAYKKFFEHMTDMKIFQIKIVHLSKDMAKFGVYNVVAPYLAYQAFRSLCCFDRYWSNQSQKLTKDIKRETL